jgi:hypothetical protein
VAAIDFDIDLDTALDIVPDGRVDFDVSGAIGPDEFATSALVV